MYDSAGYLVSLSSDRRLHLQMHVKKSFEGYGDAKKSGIAALSSMCPRAGPSITWFSSVEAKTKVYRGCS
jgi:hypothetical protein